MPSSDHIFPRVSGQMSTSDFVTIDAFERPPTGRLRWRRQLKAELQAGIPGLRAAIINYTNDGTHKIAPKLVPGGCALVAAWDSQEAAEAAFRGRLRSAIDGEGRFSLDGEVVRVRIDSESEREHWHGWYPQMISAEPLSKDEPMVAVVHAIVKRGRLAEFVRNNTHAASRAAHHPGHRGSIDVSAQLPYEHTSISLWKTYALAQDFAYKPGGHQSGMKHAVINKTHRVGVFLQLRPLAATGVLGIDAPPFPDLPPANRGGL